MAFDLDMIRGAYARMQERVEAARTVAGKPFTLAKKILYPRLRESTPIQLYRRRESDLGLVPIRFRG